MAETFHKKTNCRLCNSSDLSTSLSLTPSPPGNNFVKDASLSQVEQCFPLDLDFCRNCHHIQLGHIVDPSLLFQNDYSYVSSTSDVFVSHLSNYAGLIFDKFNLKKGSFVIDVGSNDGTCLSFFKKRGAKVLGIDPAKNIARIANDNGIETIGDFFNYDLAKSIKNNYGAANLITSHNACAHIDDLAGVIQGVSELLKEDGIFVMEVGYFVDVFSNKWFDTIYHEHLDFHTVKPLIDFFKRFDLEVFDVERISPQGGSIRVMVQRKGGKQEIGGSIDELMLLEKELGLDKEHSLKKFEFEINETKTRFNKLIGELKAKGKSIAAFGAPTKATTLCHHFDIGNEMIDFIVDDNPLKQGLFSPGKHIPVLKSEEIYKREPDYLIILAWNFADSIMKKHEKYGSKIGSFIVPMPSPKIVST